MFEPTCTLRNEKLSLCYCFSNQFHGSSISSTTKNPGMCWSRQENLYPGLGWYRKDNEYLKASVELEEIELDIGVFVLIYQGV